MNITNKLRSMRWALLVAILCMASWSASAQSAHSLRINEVLVVNEHNFLDDYGNKHPWIEIYNTSAATVNIGQCYLTNDLSNPKMYAIPKGDVLTKIPPHQHTLFWVDNDPGKGTFHVNFEFDPTKENFVALIDADGKTVLDSITIPAGLPADVSYAREVDGGDKWVRMERVTPSTNNKTQDYNENLEFFREHDGYGIIVTLVSMLVVFSALILLYFIFKFIGRTAVRMTTKKVAKSTGKSTEEVAGSAEVPGEVYAAIAMALYELENDAHDDESSIITINRVKKRYSPWSSKIYTLRQLPEKR